MLPLQRTPRWTVEAIVEALRAVPQMRHYLAGPPVVKDLPPPTRDPQEVLAAARERRLRLSPPPTIVDQVAARDTTERGQKETQSNHGEEGVEGGSLQGGDDSKVLAEELREAVALCAEALRVVEKMGGGVSVKEVDSGEQKAGASTTMPDSGLGGGSEKLADRMQQAIPRWRAVLLQSMLVQRRGDAKDVNDPHELQGHVSPPERSPESSVRTMSPLEASMDHDATGRIHDGAFDDEEEEE